MPHDSTSTITRPTPAPRVAAPRATIYAIRGAGGGWWSDVLGRFLRPQEMADPLDLPLLIAFFESMIGAIGYGVHHDMDARDPSWEAVPFPIVAGFNDRPQVQA